MNPLKFFLITDTHYFKNSLGAYGEDYERFMDFEQKCFAETQSINEAVFAYLEQAKQADIVLIAGDLSFNGEKQSNEAFSALLHDFQAKSGKKVYVVTAGHDFNEKPFAYDGGARITPEGTKFTDLYGLYKDFGYSDAIAFNEKHLSYVAQLSPEVRLLVICNDIDGQKHITYDDEFLGWIEAQAKQAQADGQMMIAMEHYPVLPGQPLLALIGDARQSESRRLIDTLADNGVHLIFTGHMHNQSINVTETAKGNKFYDVCTGSTIGCPAFMRLVTVTDKDTVEIESIPVPEFDWDKKGLTGEEYLRVQFERMIRTVIRAMKDDPERFMGKVNMKKTPFMMKVVRFGGKRLSKITVGGLARLFFIRADKSVKKMLFVDFAIDMVRSVFEGNQPFVEGTPGGDVLLKLFRRISRFKKTIKDSQGEELDLYDMLKNTVGNYGIDDYNAVLKLS